MTSQADREVVFTLKPEVAEGAKKAFDSLGSMADRAYKSMENRAKTAADRQASALATAADRAGVAMGKSYASLADRAARVDQQRVNGHTKSEAAMARASEQATAQRAKAEEKAAREAERLRDREEKAEIARERRTFMARQKAIQDRQRAEERAAKEQERAIARATREAERAQSLAVSSGMAMGEAFKQTASGATALARGMVLVGAASEEDMAKALRMVARVEAGVQAVRGTINLVQGASKMWRAYTASVEAAAAAHAALRAAQVLGGVTGGASAGASAAGSAIAGVAGSAGASLAGVAGGKLVGLAGAAGGIASLATAAIAATAALVEWSEVAYRSAKGMDPYGGATTQAGGKLASWWATSGWTGTSIDASHPENVRAAAEGRMGWLPFTRSYYQAEAGRVQSGEKTKRMEEAALREAAQAKIVADATRTRLEQQDRLAGFERQRSILGIEGDIDRRGLTGVEAEAERARRVEQQDRAALAAARARSEGLGTISDRYRSQAEGAAFAEEKSGAEKAMVEAENRLIQSAQERLAKEREIAQTRIAAADEAIDRTKSEIQLREQAVEAERQRLMTAQERIASMTDEEQQTFAGQVRTVRGKQQRGETLTAEEYRFTQQWSGLREFETIKSEQTQRRAAGLFGELDLGREEQQRLERERAALQAAEVTLKGQQEVKVNLQMDTTATIDKIKTEVKQLMEDQYKRFSDQLHEELQREVRGVEDRIRRRATQASLSTR